jgi:exodeoxyribonuclease VII small subunit
LSYEEAYNRLESVLARLESGDLPLNEALSLYEAGSLLAAHCAQKLEEAELKVRQWQSNDEVSKFEDWE